MAYAVIVLAGLLIPIVSSAAPSSDDDESVRQFQADATPVAVDSGQALASDPESPSDPIVVNAGNTAPVAVNDAFTTSQDTRLTVTAPGVLANDTDAEGDELTVAVIREPANGTVVLDPDGSFFYTPDPDFAGVDSFDYVVSDATGSDVSSATIDVIDPNDTRPVAGAARQTSHGGRFLCGRSASCHELCQHVRYANSRRR